MTSARGAGAPCLALVLALGACGDDGAKADTAPEDAADTALPDDADATSGEVAAEVTPDGDPGDAPADGETACDPGSDGCDCDPDEACDDGLVCDEARCRPALQCADLVCVLHQLCAGGVEADAACLPACDSGYTWDPDGGAGSGVCEANPVATCSTSTSDPDAIGDDCAAANKTCVTGQGGGASCGDCLAGYLLEAGANACRLPKGCDDLGCAQAQRECVAATSDPAADASCGACIGPAIDQGGACVTPGTCAELGCAALGRACVDDGYASCEGCLDGLFATNPADPRSACVESLSCANLQCTGTSFCQESDTAGQNATCITAPCGSGQAYDQGDAACVTCSGACDKAGQTGRFWLYTRSNGSCVCETQADWYLDTTLGATPKPCDADGDGWIRTAAKPFVEPAGVLDPAVAANARCDLHTIDRVTLQNEWAQRYEVRLCAGAPVAAGADCAAPSSLSLFEPTELDDQASLTDPVKFPAYGAGRALRAEELSPVTKACVSDGADLNGNGIEDLGEAAEMTVPDGVVLSDIQRVLLHFGHFIELATSWWEPRPGEEHGTLVIAERSRCDTAGADAFALVYDEAGGSAYWRECTRNRSVAFDRAAGLPGFDFARWQCDATSGSCPTPPPPTAETPGTAAPAHGLCQVTLPPPDGQWRGMTHHSQFACKEIVASASEPWQLARAALYDKSAATGGTWQYDACRIDIAEALHGADNPTHVGLACQATRPDVGAVGFVARRYQDDTDEASYAAGCIDEWRSWPALCPGWDTSLPDDQQSTVGDGQSTAFGQLACGCGENYGGLSCELGCADADVMVSPGYAVSPRAGYWLCGDVGGSACAESCDGAFAIDDFSGWTQAFSHVGASRIEDGVLRVTPDETGQQGAAWFDEPVQARDAFVVRFGFRMHSGSGDGADGMAFVLQSQGYVTGNESGTGSGVAVAFDSFDNGGGGAQGMAIIVGATTVKSLDLGGDWSNSGTHDVEVRYEPGRLTATVDGVGRLTHDLDLATVAGGEPLLGFTARTGGSAEAHDIVTLSYGCATSCETNQQVVSDGDGAVWTLSGDVVRYGVDRNLLHSDASACDALSRPSATWGEARVCGTTPSACPAAGAFASAEAACQAQGWRLCTLAELHGDETRQSGCNFDQARVWSSTPCGADSYWTAAGASSNAATLPDQCLAATSGSAAARCCLDDTTPATGWRLR